MVLTSFFFDFFWKKAREHSRKSSILIQEVRQRSKICTVYDSLQNLFGFFFGLRREEVEGEMQRLSVGMMSSRVTAAARTRWIQVRRSGGMGVKKDFRIEVGFLFQRSNARARSLTRNITTTGTRWNS